MDSRSRSLSLTSPDAKALHCCASLALARWKVPERTRSTRASLALTIPWKTIRDDSHRADTEKHHRTKTGFNHGSARKSPETIPIRGFFIGEISSSKLPKILELKKFFSRFFVVKILIKNRQIPS